MNNAETHLSTRPRADGTINEQSIKGLVLHANHASFFSVFTLFPRLETKSLLNWDGDSEDLTKKIARAIEPKAG